MKKAHIKRLLNSILGRGIDKNNGDIWYHCPFCKHRKRKLSVNIITEKWHCWVCNAKGRKLFHLLKKLKVAASKIKELTELLGSSVGFDKVEESNAKAFLPLEFIPMLNGNVNNPNYKNAIHYLKTRGLNKIDILRYNIGYAETGEHNGMIIIPSYDKDGILNYYVSRAFYETDYKHKNPKTSKDIVGFELLVNWDEPINIVEGAFDAIATGENSIPLFGKTISDTLRKRIIENKVKRINLILDRDALKSAITHAEYFMGQGIDVHLIELPDKDPSDLGKELVKEFINNSISLTFGKIMEYKLNAAY